MKRLTLLFIGSIFTLSTFAQVDGTLSYQGYLTDSNGDPEVGDHSFKFNFYVGSSSTVSFSRGPIFTTVDKGLFTVTIGGGSEGHGAGTVDNDVLPLDIWGSNYEIGIAVDGASTDLARVPLTAVPYSFQSETTNSVAGANITGTISSTLLTGTIDNTLLDDDLQDLADGSLTGSKVGTGISATNVTTGTLPNSVLNADLQDLADGSLTGSKVGSGISATNVTTGTLPNGVLNTHLQDLADGTLTGSKVGSGMSGANISDGTIPTAKISGTIAVEDGGTGASTLTGILQGNGTSAVSAITAGGGSRYLRSNAGNTAYEFGTISVSADEITTGTLTNTVLDADLQDLAADGSLSGSRVDPDFGAQDVTTTSGLHVGGTSSPGTDNMIVDGTVSVGSGSSPTTTFEVSHGNGNPMSGEGLSLLNSSTRWTFAAQSGGELYLYLGNSSLRGIFSNTDGSYANSSDRRIKKNISQTGSLLSAVKKIPIYTYHYKTQEDDETRKIGTIAQDLLPIFPSLVEYSKENDFYTVNYSGMSAIAIKAIQEQQKLIEYLQTELKNTKQDLSRLENERSKMASLLDDHSEKLNHLLKLSEQKTKPNNELTYSELSINEKD